jgi:hypothetical protein
VQVPRVGTRSGSRRSLPNRLTDVQRQRLSELLEGDRWVLRGDWEPWLDGERDGAPRPLGHLTRDQCIAALWWLRQHRHELHQVVGGHRRAPDGWLEASPLYQALTTRATQGGAAA